VQIAVIAAYDTHTEKLEVFDAELRGAELVPQAKEDVAARGYRVMHDADGGCCEVQEDYVAVTVWPQPTRVTV